MADKEFDSVSKMVDSISGADSLTASVKKRIAQRRLVKALFAMRTGKKIPQSRIAEKLKCSQSRVSKIENGFDADLSFGEAEAYARVLGCDIHLMFLKRNMTAVDRVKMHATLMKRDLDNLADCAKNDRKIAEGVASFLGEAFVNLVGMLQSTSAKLPKRHDDKPYIHIGLSLDSAVEEPTDEDCDCPPEVAASSEKQPAEAVSA